MSVADRMVAAMRCVDRIVGPFGPDGAQFAIVRDWSTGERFLAGGVVVVDAVPGRGLVGIALPLDWYRGDRC